MMPITTPAMTSRRMFSRNGSPEPAWYLQSLPYLGAHSRIGSRPFARVLQLSSSSSASVFSLAGSWRRCIGVSSSWNSRRTSSAVRICFLSSPASSSRCADTLSTSLVN